MIFAGGSGSSGADLAAIFSLFALYSSTAQYGSIYGNAYGTTITSVFSHVFALGQEVRTVPEPSPLMAQLGAAIGLLGILGARTGMAAIRARRKSHR